MGRLVLLVGSILLMVGSGLGAIYEFGEDNTQSVVVATSNGVMNIFQKVRRVQFMVPPCHKVVYVRVEVQNEFTSPEVTYSKDTNTVVIHYKLLQSSYCTYNIVVKAIHVCGQNKLQNKFNKYRAVEFNEGDEDYDFDEIDYIPLRMPKKYKQGKYLMDEYQVPDTRRAYY